MARPRSMFVVPLVLLLTLLGGATAGGAQDASSEAGGPGGGAAQPGGTLPGEPSVELVKVADGLRDPVNIAAANDGSGRLFVVERVGYVRIIDADGALLEEPFLDIADAVKTDFLEQGLLGLAFHPDYQENGRFYVMYVDYATNGDINVVRYNVSEDDPNEADDDSAQLVLRFTDDPYVNHNGGSIRFGPDGYLYIPMGDGGLAGDPYGNAQNINNLYGKILRIDVDAAEAEADAESVPAGAPGGAGQVGGAYAIPADNPFASSSDVDPAGFAVRDPGRYHPDARPEIWAYGLRNPWQFSFDPENGDLYVTDVGQNAWEEINYQEAGAEGGANYGWDELEATHCYPEDVTECERQQIGTLPVAEYSHADGSCSITGMGVYRGEESPDLDGVYFASDYCSGKVWGLTRDAGDEWVFEEVLDTTLLATGAGQDEAGELYLTACACEFERDYDPFEDPQGTVWRIVAADQVPDGAETAPLEEGDQDATPAPAGEEPIGTPDADA